MRVEVYTFEDAEGNPQEFTTQDAVEARRYALTNNLKWLALVFEYVDTELVEDFTSGVADDVPLCEECGNPMVVLDDGTTRHLSDGSDEQEYDHDQDADHVARAPEEDDDAGTHE